MYLNSHFRVPSNVGKLQRGNEGNKVVNIEFCIQKGYPGRYYVEFLTISHVSYVVPYNAAIHCLLLLCSSECIAPYLYIEYKMYGSMI